MFGRPKREERPAVINGHNPHTLYNTPGSQQINNGSTNNIHAQGSTSNDFYDQRQYRSQNFSSPLTTAHNTGNGYVPSHNPVDLQHPNSSFPQYYSSGANGMSEYSAQPTGLDYGNGNNSNAHFSHMRNEGLSQNSSVPYPRIPPPPNLTQTTTIPGPRQPRSETESFFYDIHSTEQNNPQYLYSNARMPPSSQQQSEQHVRPHSQSFLHQVQQPQLLEREPVRRQDQGPVPQSPGQQFSQPLESAVPYVMAGLQHMTGGSGGPGALHHAAFGAQILQSLAPGATGYTNQFFGENQERVKSFMRMPKYYFAVNHRYVLRKLSLILVPFVNRTWGRQRGLDGGNFGGAPSDDGTCYLPPRDDLNAPDLYIPVMSFVTYVLVVGFVFGTRNAFTAEVLANYFSRGLGVLSMEVLVIKLLLYLINARPTPWLDVIAYRGYKFVGVVLTIVFGLLVPRLYVPALLYSATAMGIFLMRSHRRIILPRDMELHENHDLARRNAFLLFVCVLQFPIYWILARVLSIKTE